MIEYTTMRLDMNDVARYNKARWEELSRAGVLYSCPWLDLDSNKARDRVDPKGMLREIAGKDVLCLAGGGGQQSVAFALLGAKVTVLDFSETQLEKDNKAASHYDVEITTVQGDMRDLSCFGEGVFDVVWHAHSLNFVPDAHRVFCEVAKVIRVGGSYRLNCNNPFVHGLFDEAWNGRGYPLGRPYIDGEEVVRKDPYWDFKSSDDTDRRIRAPKEFRHCLSTVANGLIANGFVILGIWEDVQAADPEKPSDPDPEPGTWSHFKTVAPPWLILWARYEPHIFGEKNTE